MLKYLVQLVNLIYANMVLDLTQLHYFTFNSLFNYFDYNIQALICRCLIGDGQYQARYVYKQTVLCPHGSSHENARWSVSLNLS